WYIPRVIYSGSRTWHRMGLPIGRMQDKEQGSERDGTTSYMSSQVVMASSTQCSHQAICSGTRTWHGMGLPIGRMQDKEQGSERAGITSYMSFPALLSSAL